MQGAPGLFSRLIKVFSDQITKKVTGVVNYLIDGRRFHIKIEPHLKKK